MGNLKRIVELEDEVRKLRGELSAIRDDLYNKTIIEYSGVYTYNYIPIKTIVQMLMGHLGLQIKKTQEKISLGTI